MRLTVNIPDRLFRRAEALAAKRELSLKKLIVNALKREVNGGDSVGTISRQRCVGFPVVHLRSGSRLDLRKFDFDDLLV